MEMQPVERQVQGVRSLGPSNEEQKDTSVKLLKEELCRIQSQVDTFEEQLEQVMDTQSVLKAVNLQRFISDVEELMQHIMECERDGVALDWKDPSFRAMKWAVEDALREMK